MAKSKVFQNEKYMNDVADIIYSNLKKKVLERQQMCVWGPDNTYLRSDNSHDSVHTERDKMFEKVFKNGKVSFSTQRIPKENEIEQELVREVRVPVSHENNRRSPNISKEKEIEQELVREVGFPSSYENYRRSPKSFYVTKDENFKSADLRNGQAHAEVGTILRKTVTKGTLSTKSEDLGKEVSISTTNGNEFSDWCKRRHYEFKSKSLSTLRSTNHNFSRKHLAKSDKVPTKKRNKSKSPVPDTRQKLKSADPKYSQKYSKSMSQLDTGRNMMKPQVSIKMTDDRYDKIQEFTVDLADLSRIKRNFPKLKEILPDVDSGNRTAEYCIEAVNIILRFVFFRRYNMDAMPSTAVGVEILAAVKAWEIMEFQHIFHKDFLQKTLPSSNVCLVFSQASHYGLNEVCDACKEIAESGISLNCSTYKRKQKKCLITISTYIEPLEYCIPFHPMEKDFELSFERKICNTVRFQALSGSYTVIGICIELNGHHLEGNICSNLNMLKIDYSTKNVSEDQEIETGRYDKPQRPINVIYFNKHLVVNPTQTVEVTVETDIEPYLCSALPKEIDLKKRDKGGEFCLTVVSDFKLPKSGKNLCIVGKLLYHVQKVPNGKIQ